MSYFKFVFRMWSFIFFYRNIRKSLLIPSKFLTAVQYNTMLNCLLTLGLGESNYDDDDGEL